MNDVKAYPNLIGGEPCESGDPVTITNPHDNSPIGAVFNAAKDDAARAIELSARAFESTKRMPAHARKKILSDLAELVSENAGDLAELLCRENGKPIALAKGEISRAVGTLELCAEEAGRLVGEYIPFDSDAAAVGRFGLTRRVPLGPVTAITPFNFPLNLLAHKVGPAIAIGAPIIHKPSVQAPLTGFKFARLVYEAGWPKDAYSVIYAEPDVAQLLVTDERIGVLSFTGSDAVGWHLKGIAGKKRVLLELGGSASCIVEPDLPDLDYALSRCVTGAFSFSGQICISVQRLMVNDAIYDDFASEFVDRARDLVCGNPIDEKTDLGPVIDDAAAARIEKWIDNAVAAGAHVLTGEVLGDRMFKPFVLENVPDGTEVGCREVFGPVVALYRYHDLDEAIEMTNSSRYGLQSGIFTRDIGKAMKAWDETDVGGLIVNDVPTWRTDAMPYGGTKDSGVGREGPRYAIEDMTEIRTMVINP